LGGLLKTANEIIVYLKCLLNMFLLKRLSAKKLFKVARQSFLSKILNALIFLSNFGCSSKFSLFSSGVVFNILNLKERLLNLRYLDILYYKRYIMMRQVISRTYLCLILSQFSRNIFISLNRVTGSGFKCIATLSCGMAGMGRRRKQKNSKQAVKVISTRLAELTSRFTINNPQFKFLIILLKGRARLWKFKWVLRSVTKGIKNIRIRVYLDRTNKVYGLVRQPKLRRV
jgi:hypothetical protein